MEIDENTMSELNAIVKKGMRTVREVTHARILLLTHSGRRSNERNHAELGNKTENRQRNKDWKMDQKIEKREGKTDNNLRDEKK